MAIVVFAGAGVQAADTCEGVFAPDRELVANQLDELQALINRPGDVNPAHLAQAVLAKTRLAFKMLGVLGGTYQTPDQETFDIVSIHGATELNAIAAKIDKAYQGALLISFPQRVVDRQFDAGVSELTIEDSTVPILILGPRVLAETLRGLDPLDNPLVVHELRHLKTISDILGGIENSLYGSIQAFGDEKIPQSYKTEFSAYSTYMSFDELQTFVQQAKQQLIQLRGAIRSKKPVAEISRAIAPIVSSIQFFYRLSDRAKTTAELFASQPKPDVSFEGHAQGFIEGVARVGNLELRLPILRSKGPHDPDNRATFDRQLQSLVRGTQTAKAQSIEVVKLLNLLLKEGFGVDDLDKLQGLMNPRAFTKATSGDQSYPRSREEHGTHLKNGSAD